MAYNQYQRQYSAFSGTDIIATFANRHIGNLQGVSITSTREIAPLYTMGSKNPRGFAKGKRGIAGSLIFLTFDRESLLDTIKDLRNMHYVAKAHEVRQNFDGGRAEPIVRELDADAFVSGVGEVSYQRGQGGEAQQYHSLDYVLASPMYYDEIPPFTIVLTAVNEAGQNMRMHILGVQIMNAGTGSSIDDITLDTTCTFVATEIIPWHKQGFVDADGQWHAAGDAAQPLWG